MVTVRERLDKRHGTRRQRDRNREAHGLGAPHRAQTPHRAAACSWSATTHGSRTDSRPDLLEDRSSDLQPSNAAISPAARVHAVASSMGIIGTWLFWSRAITAINRTSALQAQSRFDRR